MVLGGRYAVHVPFMERRTSGRFYEGAAGRATEKGSLYAKASILHEFKGDTAATFSAEGEDTSRVEQDFGDTWAELTLGGVYRLNGSNLFYANVTRGFGGDYKVEWKVNAGLRFAF